MKPRDFAVIVVLFLCAVGLVFLLRKNPPPAVATPDHPIFIGAASPVPAPTVPKARDEGTAPQVAGVASNSPGAHAAATAPAPGGDAASPAPTAVAGTGSISNDSSVNVAKVRRMIVDYHASMGENPIGTNAEIMKEVMGANARQATFGPPDGQALNANGELIDEWGTPYFFHQLSKDRMEVRSAGPDRIMGTSDDIVVR